MAFVLIDFDEKFNDYLTEWMEKNSAKYRNADEMEEAAPEVYMEWLSTPAQWLDGACPGTYFDSCSDAAELCGLLVSYLNEDICVPDVLLERIADLGDDAAVMALLTDESAPCEARMMAIDLLDQMASTAPMVTYLRWQVERNVDDDLLDKSIDALTNMGESVKGPALVAFRAADSKGKDYLLDVLCNYPGDEEVFQYTLSRFKDSESERALFAGYLAKLGDDRALEALLDVAESDDVKYIDFIEIRSAIERLGSEAPVRDFSNDPTYKAVKRLQVNPYKGRMQ
jgi:hypothetical protein